jgi:hypothetical protein
LQERRQARRDVLLTPKDQAVIETERQDSRDGQQYPVPFFVGKRYAAHGDEREQNERGNYKSDSGEGEWRKIGETKLDE